MNVGEGDARAKWARRERVLWGWSERGGRERRGGAGDVGDVVLRGAGEAEARERGAVQTTGIVRVQPGGDGRGVGWWGGGSGKGAGVWGAGVT